MYFETGSTWSTPIVADPLQTLDVPKGTVGIGVTLLAPSGTPQTAPSDFPFILTFASSGNFAGTVTAFDPGSAPVPVAFFLANQSALDAAGNITIDDTAANVSANFDALNVTRM